MSLSRAVAGAVVFIGCCLAAGCGGAKVYRVSGKVTFKGQPVPEGKIYFTPDTTKGNTGPAGFADIKNGEYDTQKGGQGITGGPMVVAITGVDPAGKLDKADTGGDVTAKSLFPRYETKADLPKSDGTKDFDVPVEALKPPPKQPVDTGP